MRHRITKKGIQQLNYEPQMHAAMQRTAAQVAATARSMAPKRTGTYAASIESRLMGYRWARARVYARDFKAHWMEHGAGASPVRGGRSFPAHNVLEQATKANGLRWEEGPG